MKESNRKYLQNVKNAEEVLARQIKNWADKDLTIRSLQSELSKISTRYDEMKTKLESAIETKVSAKTRQLHQLVKDLSMQVSALLFENTKLRRYIEKESGKIVLPLPIGLVSEEHLSDQKDRKLYTTLESLIKQNNEMKMNIGVRVEPERPSTSRSEHDTDKLLNRIGDLLDSNTKCEREKESLNERFEEGLNKNRELLEKLNSLQIKQSTLEQQSATDQKVIARLKKELSMSFGNSRDDAIDSYVYLNQLVLKYTTRQRYQIQKEK